MSRLIRIGILLALTWPPPGARAQPAADLRCVVLDGGARVAGELSVDGRTFRGCDRGLALATGTHRVTVRRRDALAGSETTRWVHLEPGQRRTLEVHVETGELVLLAVGNANAAAATAEVWHDGQVRGRLHSGLTAHLGAGTYVVDARSGDERRRFGPVHVTPGGRTVLVWQTGR